jgi:hypothetical protein
MRVGTVVKGESPCLGYRRALNTPNATWHTPLWHGVGSPGCAGDPWQARKHCVRNPGDPASGLASLPGPHGEPMGYDCDGRVQGGGQPQRIGEALEKRASALDLAERVESRGLAKRNSVAYHRGRTQGRETLPQVHDWVRQALCACAFDPRQEPSAVVSHAGLCAGGWVTGSPTTTVSTVNRS